MDLMIEMNQAIWLLLAGIGGVASILGWLMVLGSLLLWLRPVTKEQDTDTTSQRLWQQLKLSGVSLAIALFGTALLVLPQRIPLN